MGESATAPARAAPPGAEEPRICVGSFRGRLDQVGRARRFLAEFLAGWAGTDEAVLLAGELCANAVLHTGSGGPGGTFTIRAVMAGRCLRAEVEDQGSPWNGDLTAAQAPHGLFLLRELSSGCGTRPGTRGWITWFTLADPAVPGRLGTCTAAARPEYQ
jgi:anti-sigma regulatory factor (Ser/Thr protein kinase)